MDNGVDVGGFVVISGALHNNPGYMYDATAVCSRQNTYMTNDT